MSLWGLLTGLDVAESGAPIPTPTPMNYETFIGLYPQFSAVPQSLVEGQLTISGLLLDKDAWGNFYDTAIGLDSAHNVLLMQMAQKSLNGGFEMAAGPITSVSAGGVSTSFNSPHVNDRRLSESWYSKTVYGQMFLRLRNAVIPMAEMAV